MTASQPKLAIIQFHELNKTAKVQNPYRNFENDTIDIVENEILMIVLFEKYERKSFQSWLSWHALYYNFYQRQGVNEGDFILEFAWRSYMHEDLIPDCFKRLFDTMNVSLPIPHTSTLFEARLITSFDKDGENITINEVDYTRIYLRMFIFKPFNDTRYLQMTPLLICYRVSLPLSTFRITDGSLYRQAGDVGVALPDHYIITENYIEMCADDYFNLTSDALKLITRKYGNSRDKIDEISKILSFVCSCISIVCLIITITT